MEFNDVTFELLRYWLNNHPLKCCTSYTSCRRSIIDEKELLKDLGVLMFSNGTFTDHIKDIITKVKKIVPWILQTFNCHTSHVMLNLWKLMVLPHLEYASRLLSPSPKGQIQKLEALQWSYLHKIKSNHRVDYRKTLKKYGLYSVECRREGLSYPHLGNPGKYSPKYRNKWRDCSS